MKTVTDYDIAVRAAQAAGHPPETGSAVVGAAIEAMRDELAAGNRVVLANLLSLQMSEGGVVEARATLPGQAEPVQVAAAAEPALRAAAGPKHAKIMLVVPMKDMFVDIIAQRLGGERRTVSVAEGMERCRQMLDEFAPDIVVIDGNLGETEDILREIKLTKERGLIGAVVIHPEGTDPSEVKGLHVCEDESLVEPYDIEDLARLVDSEIERIGEERTFFDQEVHFQFQTAEDWIERANDLMARLVEVGQLDEEKAAALSVAFREAVDNAARHGNRSQEGKVIDTIYLLDKQKVTVTVEDEGDGFDTELYLTRGIQGNAVAAARERNQAGRVGGLGIMLMLKCLDDLEYNYVGNLVKLTKYR